MPEIKADCAFNVMGTLSRRQILALLSTTCGASSMFAPGIAATAAEVSRDFAALIKAAKAEGSLTLYSAATENVCKRVAEGFAAKYGIKTDYLRLAGVPLEQRYASEAVSGNVAADVLLLASDVAGYAKLGLEKGWFEPIESTGLPALTSGEFPSKYVRGTSAVVQIGPWLIGYNTETVAKKDIPREWTDVLKPMFKGKIFIPDPANSDAYLDCWALLLDRYGESFFTQLRAQEPRLITGANIAVQRVAAGEGALVFPQIVDSIAPTKDKGAPIETVTPDFTTGVEMQVLLTSATNAKHPNTARLFVNYILSKEGNLVLNGAPGIPNMYDVSGLPREYQSPRPETQSRKSDILRLFKK